MKAGTTTLYERLAQHPGVARPKRKEPGFFTEEDSTRESESYRELWPEELDGRVRIEASTGYTRYPRNPRTFARMRAYADEHELDVRFVYSLREPLERIRSHLTHWVAAGMDAQTMHARNGSLTGPPLAVSMYAMQIDAFTRHFDLDQLKLVRFEELVEATETTLADIASFLGLDPDQLNKSQRVHNPSSEKYRKSKAWSAMEALGLDRLTGALPEPVVEHARNLLGDPLGGKIELTPAQEDAYLRALAVDIRRLRDVYDVDVSNWRLPEDPGVV